MFIPCLKYIKTKSCTRHTQIKLVIIYSMIGDTINVVALICSTNSLSWKEVLYHFLRHNKT